MLRGAPTLDRGGRGAVGSPDSDISWVVTMERGIHGGFLWWGPVVSATLAGERSSMGRHVELSADVMEKDFGDQPALVPVGGSFLSPIVVSLLLCVSCSTENKQVERNQGKGRR